MAIKTLTTVGTHGLQIRTAKQEFVSTLGIGASGYEVYAGLGIGNGLGQFSLKVVSPPTE